jgi:hypothetical protein
MIPPKEELIASLQNEVRVLLRLGGKSGQIKLDYRPPPSQLDEMNTMNLRAGTDGKM